MKRPSISASDSATNNTGKPWSNMDLVDLKSAIERGETIEEAAELLCRSVHEVRDKAQELNLAATLH